MQNITVSNTGGAQQCGTSVSFKYPYGFNLPFQSFTLQMKASGADASRKSMIRISHIIASFCRRAKSAATETTGSQIVEFAVALAAAAGRGGRHLRFWKRVQHQAKK